MRLRFRGKTYYAGSYTPPVDDKVPRLTRGMELQGEYRGSGHTKPHYLARRVDGQVLQMSHLLYLVASEIDGQRNLAEIAARVTETFGRGVSPKNIDYLIENQLLPLGVVSSGEDDELDAKVPRTDLLFGVSGRRVLIPQRLVVPIARSFAWLYLPPIVIAMVVGLGLMDYWIFQGPLVSAAIVAAATQPSVMLAVLGITLVSIVFHEFGHAAGCYYSGARPGNIGCGIYIIWPAMYTDVTDVYRATKGGRVRTDLGGIYFNVIFILAMGGCYGLTGKLVFLAAALLMHFEIVEQLLPIVRLDGYYILGDLAGIPDLFGKVSPILKSALRRGPPDPMVADLKRSSRIVVVVWMMLMLPLLGINIGVALWNLPRIIHATIKSVTKQLAAISDAWTTGQYVVLALDVISFVFMALPTIGLTYILIRMLTKTARAAIHRTAGRPVLRAAILGVSGLAGGALLTAWCVMGL